MKVTDPGLTCELTDQAAQASKSSHIRLRYEDVEFGGASFWTSVSHAHTRMCASTYADSCDMSAQMTVFVHMQVGVCTCLDTSLCASTDTCMYMYVLLYLCLCNAGIHTPACVDACVPVFMRVCINARV